MGLNLGRAVVSILVAVIVLASVVGGIMLFEKKDTRGDRVVTDSFGRDVSIPNEIDSIFCEDCCTLQIISWFESIDKVTGIDSRDKIVPFKTYTQVFKDRFEKLESVDVTNAEYVIRLNPSIVFCSTADSQKIADKQSQYGVPVFYINADIEFDNELWFTQIMKVGQILHEESRAKEIVDGVRAIKADLSKYDFSSQKAYVCGMMYYGMGDFLKTTGNYIPFDWVKLRNVMPPKGINGQPYNTTVENIAAVDFDYVFIDGSNIDNVVDGLRDFKNLDPNKSVFKENNIFTTLTYKIWGTQWDNVLINCYFVKHILNNDDCFENDVDKVLDLFYHGKITHEQLKSLNPNSFERKSLNPNSFERV